MTSADQKRPAIRSTVRWVSGVNVLAGVWLMLAPFALGYGDVTAAVWNDVIIGLSVFVLALFREAKPLEHEGVSWTNFVLGLWLLAAPFVAGYGDVGSAVGNDITVGIVVLIFAAWSAVASRDVRPA
ncbi:MAG: SPW repeat protein [Actinobacteria bacterium]|nr:SPW repeat protein [Actinomycetota bacterium]